ncbi:MAG TPA: ABC transporter permease [Synergistales bacterium]|nr:ABC transporter permease [Synergistales bacterium]HPK42061.1 ABC transporter permease [Synergistales bacterium]
MARLNWRRHGNLAVLAALLAVLASRDPGVLSTSNITNVIGQAAVMGICAVGMTFVILTGGIDLSVGSIVALSGALGAWLNVQAGLPWQAAWASAILAGTACGLVSGLLVHWGRVPPFMATLAVMAAARGLTLLLTQGSPISGTSPAFNFAGWASLSGFPVSGMILLACATAAWVLLRFTPFGTGVYALGDNPEAARFAGIPTGRITVSVYAVSGSTAGLAGLLMVGRLWSAQPGIGMGLELDVIASVVLGGTSLFGGVGTIRGTLTGVLIMGFLDNGLRILGISSYLQQVIKGMVFIGAVILDMYFKGAYRKGRSRDAS